MNQLCRVCGEPAAGFHFGAFTCEGCKSFFGRTYNNINSISECKNNGECVINKKNRTSCKACRLRKCLLVGMSKSGSRYGRRSNWFKIHCLLQEQQQNQHTAVKPGKGWDGVTFHGKHILDIDNNNTPPNTKDSSKDRSLSPMLLTPGSYNHSSSEAAAALWAARSSMLPVPHHPGLPFFAPSFLHNTSFHQPPPSPNFLIPFLPTRQPQQQPEVPVLSTSSSTSSSPSPEVQNTADKSTTTDLLNYDKCLSVLRSLGPVQETPMDLSLRTMDKHRDSDRESSNGDSDTSSKRKKVSGENSKSNKDDGEDVMKDVKPDDELEKKIITTPLDLTCTKS